MGYLNPATQREYQRKWRSRRRQEYLDLRGNTCEKCGSGIDLEFHHRNREDKEEHKIWSWSRQRIEVEIAKCDLLCAACHFKETVKERGYYQYVHGTHTCYTQGKCRCELCREANRIAQRSIPSFKLSMST